jgi:hypothetical protein
MLPQPFPLELTSLEELAFKSTKETTHCLWYPVIRIYDVRVAGELLDKYALWWVEHS